MLQLHASKIGLKQFTSMPVTAENYGLFYFIPFRSCRHYYLNQHRTKHYLRQKETEMPH